jgi:WD40 repeat protein
MPNHILAMRASADGRLFGTSSDDETIKVWDAVTLTEIASIRPGFSGGEDRLALDPTSSRVFSGTWEAGLTCYDYTEHREVWRRADLIGIQRVDFSPAFPSSLFVALEAPDYRVDEPGVFSGVVELDAATGRLLWRTDDADTIFLHPSRPLSVLVDRRERIIRILDDSRRLIGSTPMIYFAVLEVAFHGEVIALAEGGEGIRLIDTRGRVQASHRPPSRESNCLRISFVGGADALAAFDSWEGSYITRLDGAGQVVAEYERESHEDVCFIGDGTRFLDAQGRVCRTATGAADMQIKAWK